MQRLGGYLYVAIHHRIHGVDIYLFASDGFFGLDFQETDISEQVGIHYRPGFGELVVIGPIDNYSEIKEVHYGGNNRPIRSEHSGKGKTKRGKETKEYCEFLCQSM
jgi:hypothetical protein